MSKPEDPLPKIEVGEDDAGGSLDVPRISVNTQARPSVAVRRGATFGIRHCAEEGLRRRLWPTSEESISSSRTAPSRQRASQGRVATPAPLAQMALDERFPVTRNGKTTNASVRELGIAHDQEEGRRR